MSLTTPDPHYARGGNGSIFRGRKNCCQIETQRQVIQRYLPRVYWVQASNSTMSPLIGMQLEVDRRKADLTLL